MTPIDRKIEIMNRVYASNVLRLTEDIIELKMEIERMKQMNDTTIKPRVILEKD